MTDVSITSITYSYTNHREDTGDLSILSVIGYNHVNAPSVQSTKPLYVISLILSLLSLASCDSSIYDDLSSCPQGMEFSFASQTPCKDKLSLDRMTGLMLQIYDEKGVLVKAYDKNNMRVTPDFKLAIPFATPGTYTFTFWGMEAWQPYKRSSGISCGLTPSVSIVSQPLPALFYGSLRSHKIVDRSRMGTVIESFEINMLPYTHNFDIEVSGLLKEKDYTIMIESDNATYDHNGESLKTPVSYIRSRKSIDGSIKVSMNTLRQARNGGTKIRVKESLSDRELLNVSLNSILSSIERQTGAKINPDCMQDFNLKLDILTHESIRITLNQWNIVYRSEILR